MKKDNKKKKNLKKEISIDEKKKNRKKFVLFFLILVGMFSIGLVKKTFQNDTFYTIEIGELIINNGIDMMDHFSYHSDLAYTYPHWLYDVFIYLVYMVGGYTGIYISSIVLFLILLGLVFKTNHKITNNLSVSAFASFICTLAVSGFATARAQLVSFLIFVLQIYFIENFLKNGKKKYLFGLLLLSLLICNIHVAVWPFYFIIYLPYVAEFLVSWIASKIKLKKENKFIKFLKDKFVTEKNNNMKYILIIMVASLLTGFMTPIGTTPFTYMFKMSISNAQEYVLEHQMLSWANSPFTIIIALETIFLSFVSKVKLRDFFMICGLIFMSIISVRHLSLLALIGTICFARLFAMFLENFNFDVDDKIVAFFTKTKVMVISLLLVVIFTSVTVYFQNKSEYVDPEMYPIGALEYIKENINVDEMRIFNEYNFGSYLLHHDIPVFIDSRAELYTAPFSGFEYDIFDDYSYIHSHYQEKFAFYDISHILIYKKNNALYYTFENSSNYKNLYEDEYFVLYERLGDDTVIIFK